MATNTVQGKWDPVEEEEEEEEALSLCDLPLPVTMINHTNQPSKEEHPHQEEFDFRGLFSKQPEMCVADEVFFQGKILPLRHSFSSEYCNNKSRPDQSLGHGNYGSVISEFRSNSSRSSSLRSQNSSSSTSSTTTTTPTPTPRISKPRFQFQNQFHFHTHPSPKPQLKTSAGSRQASFGRKSSVWEIFRLGVVPAPEIGLQDLKVRSTNSANKNCVSRNSSSSSNSTAKSDNKMSTNHSEKRNHFIKHLVGKGGGLLSGCDCSIETVQYDSNMGGGTKSTNKKESATTTHAVKEKVVELKKQKQRKKQGKKVMSRRRTFEWLKELHANPLDDDDDDDEEALLSNAS